MTQYGDPGDRSGDLYDSSMGDVRGGNISFGETTDHHVVYGDGMHFSWDTDRDGNVSGLHFRDDVAHETIWEE